MCSSDLWLVSSPGEGARFTIFLPKVEQTVARVVAAQPRSPLRGVETLLIVEDEGSLRAALCEFLIRLGYTVLAASSGEEAILLASEREHLDLLLTDVVMPRMNGRELSETLRSLRPDLKVIYMSGYTDDAVLRYGIHGQRTAFLQKPFGLSALARKVRDAFDTVEGASRVT